MAVPNPHAPSLPHDQIPLATHGYNRARPQTDCSGGGHNVRWTFHGSHAAELPARTGQGTDLRAIASNHVNPEVRQEPSEEIIPERGPAGSDRVENNRFLKLVRFLSG